MPTITPCLWFDGRAEEAAAFYVSVFPDSQAMGKLDIEGLRRAYEGAPD